MDQQKDKNFLIFLLVSFVVGFLVGVCVVLLFFPEPICECDELQVAEQEGESTVDVVGEKEGIVDEKDTLGKSVSLPVSQCSVIVDIAGAVESPGVYCLEEGSTIIDAVYQAKGFTKGIAQKFVSMSMNLSSSLSDHQKIYIPFQEDVYCEIKSLQYIDKVANTGSTANSGGDTTGSTTTCVNINTASIEELTQLDGIGESTAQKIIDARPYSETSDILNVSGIGEATYEKFKDDICVY
ncbi:helix-hairpin-helix domain-containing protein [bacterium]|nr:helix-hairpin-helix domain-containing protein [bacterium]